MKVTYNMERVILQIYVTDTLYYGPDINSVEEHFGSREEINGIICIFIQSSKWDKFTDSIPRIYIVGYVKKSVVYVQIDRWDFLMKLTSIII